MEKITTSVSNKFANMALICTIFVVSFHTTIECRQTGSFLWYFKQLFTNLDFAVPFFFVMSGFFLAGHMEESGWYKDSILKRFKTLGIPYIFWNLFYFVFALSLILLGGILNISFGNINDYHLSLLRIGEIFGLNPIGMPELPFLWYIRALFIFILFSPLIRRLSVFGVSLFFLLYFTTEVFWALPTPWGTMSHWFVSLRGLAYFSLGIYLRYHPCRFFKCTGLISGALFALGIGAYILGLWLSVNHVSVLSRVLIWTAVPILLVAVWGLVPDKKWPDFLTRSSFPIFLMQSALITLFIGILKVTSLKDWAYTTIPGYFLRLIVVSTSAIIIATLLHKLAPKFSRFIFGGRG